MKVSNMKILSLKILSLALALTLAASLGFSVEAEAQQNVNIGVFDLQKTLNDSKQGKAARSSLEAKLKKITTDVDAKKKEIDALSDDLRKQVEDFRKQGEDFKKEASAAKAPTDALRKKEDALRKKEDELRKKDEDYQKKRIAYQELVNKSNAEMASAEEAALKPLVDKAIGLAGNIGKARGYILILETQQAGVVYAQDAIDVTADVIKELEK
ncbi:MAG: OmpH family outer membrane protein [Candidatus Adiutrix sp.]|nr:OmpH family outer membrane protein [Candidatus Adiutrix sp.]